MKKKNHMSKTILETKILDITIKENYILAAYSKQICWIFTNQIIIHFKTSKYDTTVFEVIYGTCLLMV